MQSLKSFTKDTSLYAIGIFSQRIIMLLLIPFFTRSLSTDQYGVNETLNVISQTLIIFFDLGVSRAILRYCTVGHGEDEIREILRTAVVISLVVSILFLFLSILFAGPISDRLLKDNAYAPVLVGAVMWTIGLALNQMQFAYFRARQQALKYLIVSVLQAVILAALNIIFVRFMHMGVGGIIWGNLLAAWLLGFYTLKNIFGPKYSISIPWAIKLLKFGAPLILSMLASIILNSADRFILAYFKPMTEVGIYGLGYKVGLVISIGVIAPFQLAWPNFVFEQEESQNPQRQNNYERILTALLLVICLFSLMVMMFAHEIILIVGTEKYIEAALVVPYIVLTYIFYAIYYYYGAFYLLKEKTPQLSVITLSMALLNIVLNILWVPTHGWLGAAWATVITVFGMSLAVAIYGAIIFPLNLHYKKLAMLLLLTATAVAVYYFSSFHGLGASYLVRLLIMAVYIALLFIFKVVNYAELKRALLSLVRK